MTPPTEENGDIAMVDKILRVIEPAAALLSLVSGAALLVACIIAAVAPSLLAS